MSAINTLRQALYGNPPSDAFKPDRDGVIAAFSQVLATISVAAQGITTVSDVAARDAFYASADNQNRLVYVNNNNGSTSDAANGVYEYVGGAARKAESFYVGITGIVQPLVDEVVAAVDQVAADITGVTAAVRSPFQPAANFSGAITREQGRRFLLDLDLSDFAGYQPARRYSFAEIEKSDSGINLRLYSDAAAGDGSDFQLANVEFAAVPAAGYNPTSPDVFVIKNVYGSVAIVPGALPNGYYAGGNWSQSGLDDSVFRKGYGAFLRTLIPAPPRLVLPSKVHALVGKETTLYYDAIALLPDVGAGDPPYLFDITCDIGTHTRRGYRVTPTSGQVGNHALTITVYDNGGAVIASASTTLVVVAAANPGSVKRILGVADSTWDDTGEMPKTLQQNLAAIGGNVPVFVGTHGAAPYNFEARSGQTLSFFARGAVRHRLTVTGFPAVPFWPILNVYGTDGVGFALLYDEINVSGGSGTITGLVVGDLQTRIEAPGWTGQLRIDGYNVNFTVTGVERLEGYSPFKDADGTGALNFADYASRNSIAAADLLVIDLGINDNRGALQPESAQQQKITDAKALAAAFLTWRTSGKVMICLPKSCASTRAEAAQHDAYRLNIHRFRELLIEEFDAGAYDARVYLEAGALMLDRFYGYTITTPVVGARYSETQVFHPDAVHPRDEGNRQRADAMTAAVLAGITS